jgi:small subunit ribosomal protein S15
VRKAERWRKAQASKPSVVLGTRPGDDAKWQNCDLAKILVDEEALVSDTYLEPTKVPVGVVHMPTQLGFGVGEAEKRLLFGELPLLSAGLRETYVNVPQEELVMKQEKELKKANAFAQLLDLRNANAAGIAYENRRRIIAAFSLPSNPFDPGRSEVQGMLIRLRIQASRVLKYQNSSCTVDISNSESLEPSNELQTRCWQSQGPSETGTSKGKNSQISKTEGPGSV